MVQSKKHAHLSVVYETIRAQFSVAGCGSKQTVIPGIHQSINERIINYTTQCVMMVRLLETVPISWQTHNNLIPVHSFVIPIVDGVIHVQGSEYEYILRVPVQWRIQTGKWRVFRIEMIVVRHQIYIIHVTATKLN